MGQDIALLEQEIEQLKKELSSAQNNLEKAKRKIRNLERDNLFLASMNENAQHIRDLNEKEILKNKQKAEEASKAKSTFLAQMSHEMRTPMNAIKVLAELLMRTELEKVQRDYASNILNASASLINIINDILDFSKLDANKIEIAADAYDFASLINDVANLINLKAIDKNLAFLTDIDHRIPCMLKGDDLRIKQIMLNILQNAVKYTSKGYVKFSIRMQPTSKPNEILLICAVKDTGVGIREKYMPILFEPFLQAEMLQNRYVEGTGLGLTISKQLLELMQGDIVVESAYGKGSTFTFRIPQTVINHTPFVQIRHPEKKHVLLAGEPLKIESCAKMLKKMKIGHDCVYNDEELKRQLLNSRYTHIVYFYAVFHDAIENYTDLIKNCKLIAVKDIRFAGSQTTKSSVHVLFEPVLVHELARIFDYEDPYAGIHVRSEAAQIGAFYVNGVDALVVDDNDVNLMVLEQLLVQYNIHPVQASNGLEAVAQSRKKCFDIIFMDHMMPEMDGIEAGKIIRSEGNPNKHTPMVMVTANALVGMRDKFLSEGMDDYISKPINISELNQILKTWLPKEKIVDAPMPADAEEIPAFVAEMGKLGIDCVNAYNAFGSNKETYRAVVNTFIDSVPGVMERLLNHKKQNSFNEFRIDVHGIKSALANIGAKKLSLEAKELETAAASLDAIFIENHFLRFYYEVLELIGLLNQIPGFKNSKQEEQSAQVPLEKGAIEKKVADINRLIEELDSIEANRLLSELYIQLSGEQQQQLQQSFQTIKTCIDNFDYEAAASNLQLLKETI